jgi:hypothetical protein
MINIIQKIIASFINASPQQLFSQQQGGQRNRNIKCFKDILNFLSGKDINNLLKSYLLSKEGKQCMDIIGIEFKDKSINIINNIKDLHNNTKKNDKYKILSLVSNDYTRNQLLQTGFQFSTTQFARSRKPNIIIESKSIKKNNKKIDDIYLSFLYQHSREASNRTILIKNIVNKVNNNNNNNNNMDLDINFENQTKEINLKRKFNDNENIQNSISNKKIYINIRYFNNSLINLYNLYKKTYPHLKISKSTFFHNIPKEFKKAKKRTDLCPICENGKKTEQCWQMLQKKIDIDKFVPININKLKEELQFIKVHKKMVEIQRALFHAEIFNLKSEHGILLIDFKENLKLGGSPNELNQDFYNKVNCSVLDTCLIYKNENNQIKKNIKIFFLIYYLMMVFLLKII